MNDWYQRMVAALQLNGKGEPTQKAYTRAVRMLCEFYHKTPDLISEPELQEYFLHRKNVNRWSPKTMRICYCGIHFFYVNVLARDWHFLEAGVNLRVIQRYMGHARLETTMLYLHLTQKGQEDACQLINHVME